MSTFPTTPNDEGFYYATEDEQSLGITTKDYDNGSTVKQVTLSDGAVAIVRRLKGRDFVDTKKAVQNNNSLDFETVNMAQGTTIDGKKHPPEYFLDDLYQVDYSKVMAAFASVNFQ